MNLNFEIKDATGKSHKGVLTIHDTKVTFKSQEAGETDFEIFAKEDGSLVVDDRTPSERYGEIKVSQDPETGAFKREATNEVPEPSDSAAETTSRR